MNRKFRNRWSGTTPLLLIFVFRLSLLSGQEPATDSVAVAGLYDIQKTAQSDRMSAQRWWYGWLAGYSAATAVQGGVSLAGENKTVRQDMALGAATTFLGAVGQMVTPMFPRDLPHGKSLTDEESAALLKALAQREKDGRSWKVHALAGAVNIGSGLITWLGFKRTFLDGLENFALNTVITEAQIWTQPTRAIRDYQDYCRKSGTIEYPAVAKPESEWTVNVCPGGFSVRLDF